MIGFTVEYWKNKWKGTRFLLGAFLILYSLEIACRLIFVLFSLPSSQWINVVNCASYDGLQLDLSMVSYELLLIALGLWIAEAWGNWKLKKFPTLDSVNHSQIVSRWKGKFISTIAWLLLLIHGLVLLADIWMFHFWQWRLSSQAFAYLRHWTVVFSTMPMSVLGTVFLVFAGVLLLWQKTHKRINRAVENLQFPNYKVWLFYLPLLLILVRGGVSRIPLNLGSAMQTPNKNIQVSAINGVWNAVFAMMQNQTNGTFDQCLLDTSIENQSFHWYHSSHPSNKSVSGEDLRKFWFLNPTSNPNIHMIILEGVNQHWLERVDSPLKQWLTYSDQFLQFSRCYAVGDRTDKGLASLISGWPGEPGLGILFSPDRWSQLHGLPNLLQNLGYSTEFWYGGDVSFANQKAFLKQMGMQSITDESQIQNRIAANNNKIIPLKWGFSDIVMANLLNEIDRIRYKEQLRKSPRTMDRNNKNTSSNPHPVFRTWLTLSSHEPFDVVEKSNYQTDRELFEASLMHVDSAIASYLESLKNNSQWNNSLIIIVSDHGKAFGLDEVKWSESEFFRIPLWIGGGALNPSLKGKKWTSVVSQADIYATMASMLTAREGYFQPLWGRTMINFNSNNAALCFKGNFSLLISGTQEILGNTESSNTPLDTLDAHRRALQSKIIRNYFR